MRLAAVIAAASVLAASGARQASGRTSVIWIYDCSQSHHSTLAPATMDRFAVRVRGIDSLTEAVAANLGPNADVRVLSFGTGLQLSPQWIRTRTELASALTCGDTLNGPSPIWDAVYRAAEVLEARSGARAILMVTDGRSSANTHGFQDALDRAKQAGVRVSIGVARTELMSSSKRILTLNANRPGDPAERLKKLTEATGGRYAELAVLDLPAFFAEIARDWNK